MFLLRRRRGRILGGEEGESMVVVLLFFFLRILHRRRLGFIGGGAIYKDGRKCYDQRDAAVDGCLLQCFPGIDRPHSPFVWQACFKAVTQRGGTIILTVASRFWPRGTENQCAWVANFQVEQKMPKAYLRKLRRQTAGDVTRQPPPGLGIQLFLLLLLLGNWDSRGGSLCWQLLKTYVFALCEVYRGGGKFVVRNGFNSRPRRAGTNFVGRGRPLISPLGKGKATTALEPTTIKCSNIGLLTHTTTSFIPPHVAACAW